MNSEYELITDAQWKKFFAMVAELGYNAEEAKDRAKARYGHEHFAQLYKFEAMELIDLLQQQLDRRNARALGGI